MGSNIGRRRHPFIRQARAGCRPREAAAGPPSDNGVISPEEGAILSTGRPEGSSEFEIFEAVADGIIVQEPSGRLIYANEAGARVLGFASAEELLAAPLDDVRHRFRLFDESGDRLAWERLPGRTALQGSRPEEIVVRWRAVSGGEEGWANVRAEPVLDEHGDVRFAVNVFRDITEQRRGEEQMRIRARQQAAVAELGHIALAAVSLDEIMERTAELMASTLEVDFTQVLDLLPHGQGFLVRAGYGWKDDTAASTAMSASPSSHAGYTLLGREPVVIEDLRSEARFSGPATLREHGVISGVCVLIPGPTKPFGALTAYTRERRTFTGDDLHFLAATANVLGTALERKSAEEGRAQLLERERLARRDAEAAKDRLMFLAEASDVLASSLNLEKVLGRVAEIAVPRLADWCAVDLLDENGRLQQVALQHVDPEKVERAKELRSRYPPDPDAPRGAAKVVRTGKPELHTDITEDLIVGAAVDEEHLKQIRALAPRSAMIVPLTARGRTFGTLTFVTAESEMRYGPEELGLAEELARRAALALDNARLYQERSHVARTLQRSLLPRELPTIPRMELAARYRSAGEARDVGGDFYDVFESGDGSWTVVVGDVCGRGVEAAALTGMVRQTLRAVASRDRSPSQVLREVNEAIIPQTADMRFCTVACARLEPTASPTTLAVSVAGHPLPMVLRTDGSVEFVGSPGTLLGLFPEPELIDRDTRIDPGDTIVICTDGVTARFETMERPGEAGLASLLEASAGMDAPSIASRIEEAAVGAGAEPHRDDMAILVLRKLR